MPSPPHRARCAALGLDAAFLRRVRSAGEAAGVVVAAVETAADPAALAADVVLAADGSMPGSLPAPGARAIVICVAHGDAEGAARSLDSGADDVVTPRTPAAEVAARLAAAAARRTTYAAHGMRHRLAAMCAPGVVGRSPAIQRLREIVELVAASEASVRIHGEPGSGKTLIARTLHGLSPRRDAPLVEVDAARLAPAEAAAALLGRGPRPGAIQAARAATVLVRSVDRLDAATQRAVAQWLRARVLPRRTGADTADSDETSDARLLVTSTEALDTLGARGVFQPELAAALAPVAVRIPPLRERPGDAALLLTHFLQEMTQDPPRIDASAQRLVDLQAWPGNVAELRGLAALLTARSPGATLGEADLLPLLAFPHPRSAGDDATIGVPTLHDVSFGHIVRVLALCGGARGRAAKALGISTRTLYNHLHGRPAMDGRTLIDGRTGFHDRTGDAPTGEPDVSRGGPADPATDPVPAAAPSGAASSTASGTTLR